MLVQYSTRVANELGAGQPEAARLAVVVVLVMDAIEALVIGAAMILIRNIWGHVYSNEQQVIKHVATMMPILALSHSIDGYQCILSGNSSKFL